jgi:hypothetical protein
MRPPPSPLQSHEVILFAAVVAIPLPAAFLVALVDCIVRFKDGAIGFLLWIPVAVAPMVCGFIAYGVALRLDPNVPELALQPAIVTTVISSIIVSFVAVVVLVATTS